LFPRLPYFLIFDYATRSDQTDKNQQAPARKGAVNQYAAELLTAAHLGRALLVRDFPDGRHAETKAHATRIIAVEAF
jgi:hypothetical protein